VEPLLPEGEELFLLDLTEAGLLTTTLGVVVVDGGISFSLGVLRFL